MLADEPNLPGEILKLLHELGVSLTYHSAWLKRLHRTLVCGAAPSSDDLAADAHCKCMFGQWYYGDIDTRLKGLPLYGEVGDLHLKVHDRARELLNLAESGRPITTDEYDQFIDVAHEFRTAVQNLQFKMVSEVCAVDHLTGVWNRYALSYKLAQEHARVHRNKNCCVIAIIDFDRFKSINDRYGHVAGDKVLKTAMAYFSDKMRAYDTIYRYGGEEFLFIFPDTEVEVAKQILERLRHELKEVAIILDSGDEVRVSVSIGMAAMDGQVGIQDVIEMADSALLHAKMNGRDSLHIWNCLKSE